MIGLDPTQWSEIGNAVWIGLGGFLIAFVVYLLFSRLTKKSWVRFIGNMISLGIVIWTIKVLLTTSGAAGVMVIVGTALTGAIALGSETIASDFISGIKLFGSRPFNPGDLVTIAAQTGTVETVGLTNTILEGDGGQRIIIRNSDVAAGTIVNHSSQKLQYISTQIFLPLNQDLDAAISAILKELNDSQPEYVDEAHKPGVISGIITKLGVTLTVFSYTKLKDLTLLQGERTNLMLKTIRALKQSGFTVAAAK